MAAQHATAEGVIAVGQTRDSAARIFGPEFDELFVTTFADFAEAPAAGDVLVTAEDGAADLVAQILAADAGRRVVLQVDSRDVLAEVDGARYDATYVGAQPCLVIAADGHHQSAAAALDALSSTPAPAPLADPKPLPVPRLYDRREKQAATADSRLRRIVAGLPRVLGASLGATSRRGKLATLLLLALGAATLVVGVPFAVGLIGGDAFAWTVALLIACLAVVQVATLVLLLLLLDRVRND